MLYLVISRYSCVALNAGDPSSGVLVVGITFTARPFALRRRGCCPTHRPTGPQTKLSWSGRDLRKRVNKRGYASARTNASFVIASENRQTVTRCQAQAKREQGTCSLSVGRSIATFFSQTMCAYGCARQSRWSDWTNGSPSTLAECLVAAVFRGTATREVFNTVSRVACATKSTYRHF